MFRPELPFLHTTIGGWAGSLAQEVLLLLNSPHRCPPANHISLSPASPFKPLVVGHTQLRSANNNSSSFLFQACRLGLVQHLERLLFYGADLDARNASGNSPLHVCAVNAQESCARTLLFRGADRGAHNFAGQTPYQVAVIAGNLELAEVIRAHRDEDVGEETSFFFFI